jgi:K(+)-stimulated pyrophosphate-energized sodium pump
MIKVVNIVSLLAAPVIVQYQGTTGAWVTVVILLAIISWAISQSRRSLSEPKLESPGAAD